MKGILLAGGLGTRLYPATRVANKQVFLLYDRPMFYWPLKTLIDSGIKDITVISGPPFGAQIKELIKHYPKEKGVRIHYALQASPRGMPDAMAKAKRYCQGDCIMVIAGDNYYEGDFKKEVKHFKTGALSFLRKVKDPQRYGVPIFKNKKVVGVEEKPKNPKTNWVITGPHFFDKNVFKYIRTLKPSARGELEITDLNAIYLKDGSFNLAKRKDKWGDTGTFDSLLKVSLMAQKNVNKKNQ